MGRRPDPAVRNGLLVAARDLFLANGFAATGLDDICRAAGVTKGALFHHFDGKEDLAIEVLHEWTRAGLRAYASAPFLHAPTAVAQALGYVDFTIELSRHAPIGCLIGTFAQEIARSHRALRARCAGAFRDWSKGLAAMLERARLEAPTALPFDAASVADHFVAVFEGAQILAKAEQSTTVVEEHLRHFRRFLEHLLGLAPSARKERKIR